MGWDSYKAEKRGDPVDYSTPDVMQKSSNWNSPSVKAVLFDFDGTIADSMKAVVQVANRLAPRWGCPTMTAADVERMRKQNLRQNMQELKLPMWKLPWLLRQVRREFSQEIAAIDPIVGMPEALRSLASGGYQLGILTSNSRRNVESFLRSHHLKEVFKLECTQASVFGKSQMLRRSINRHRLRVEQVVYVGDEVRDIEAARGIGMRVIGVAWGFHEQEMLVDAGADTIAATPAELAQLLSMQTTFVSTLL